MFFWEPEEKGRVFNAWFERLREGLTRRRSLRRKALYSVGCVSLAAFIHWLLFPYLGEVPFILFYPTVLVAALYGDGPLAVLIAAAAAQYAFSDPQYSFHMSWPSDYLRQAIFICSGMGIAVVANTLRFALRQTEEDRKLLGRKNKELDRFAVVAAHDLKAPLSTVIQFSELLQEALGPKLDPESKGYFDVIVAAGRRMSHLIDALLEYAKSGESLGQVRDVALNEVLRETLENLKAQLEVTGAQVTVEPLPVVKGDPAQIQRVFQNIIANGIKYRAEGRPLKIHVSATDQARQWLIGVRDNGIGLDPSHGERIFDPFVRLSHDPRREGAGIGLATAKKIIEVHQGKIWVESLPDRGSTFYMSFPKELVAPGPIGVSF